MVEPTHIALAAIVTGILLLLFFFFFYHPKPPQPVPENPSMSNSMTTSKPLFSWSDNPSLITDAVENGWSRFAFNDYVSSLSIRSNRFLLGSCAAGDDSAEDQEMEISWEVCQGSADFMQKIRLNTGLKKIVKTTSSAMAAVSVIKSALPLPGPVLGNSSPFPQEAYFEITVLSNYENDVNNGKGKVNTGEGENIKLIQENGVNCGNVRAVHATYEELRGQNGTKELIEGENEVNVIISIGLTVGGPLPVKLPGSYPGSVGFNSDGSIYLDGIKLEVESIIERWEGIGKVIGCGYNPSHKKVFFTLDSKLVHEIDCKEEEYGTPLYPTIAANSDVQVLVNFGQSIFKYPTANLQRTQNPCFIGPMATSSSSGYEDSKELFSMGIIDSPWLNQTTLRSGQCYANVNKGKPKDCDEASEGDMIEIVIESNSYTENHPTHTLNHRR